MKALVFTLITITGACGNHSQQDGDKAGKNNAHALSFTTTTTTEKLNGLIKQYASYTNNGDKRKDNLKKAIITALEHYTAEPIEPGEKRDIPLITAFRSGLTNIEIIEKILQHTDTDTFFSALLQLDVFFPQAHLKTYWNQYIKHLTAEQKLFIEYYFLARQNSKTKNRDPLQDKTWDTIWLAYHWKISESPIKNTQKKASQVIISSFLPRLSDHDFKKVLSLKNMVRLVPKNSRK